MIKAEDQTKSCQACQSNRTEYLTSIDDGDDWPLIYGIDYQYRCIVHDMVVPSDYYCDKFELPF